MNFARPILLLLLLALPLWWWWRARQRRTAAHYSDVAQLNVAGVRAWVASLPVALRSVVLAAWIVAAAGPSISRVATEVTSDGIAIVVVIDVSSSMLAEDFTPNNRLDVARTRAVSFVRGRPHDAIGLVTFAGEAITRVPITTDHAVLEQSILDVRVGELDDGTAIGTAIATATNRLRQAEGESRVMLLLTDGENNRGQVDPRTAALAALEFGVRIYTVGVGTEGEARMPIGRGPGGQLRFQLMPVSIDEPLLRDIAQMTGGRYFRATDAEALQRIFEQVDRLERAPIRETQYTQFDEAYRIPLLIGLAVLALELVVSAAVVVRVP